MADKLLLEHNPIYAARAEQIRQEADLQQQLARAEDVALAFNQRYPLLGEVIRYRDAAGSPWAEARTRSPAFVRAKVINPLHPEFAFSGKPCIHICGRATPVLLTNVDFDSHEPRLLVDEQFRGSED